MNLIIDIGNTNTKIAVFENDVLVKKSSDNEFTEKRMAEFLSTFPSISRVIISSVGKIPSYFSAIFKRNHIDQYVLSSNTVLPFHNSYQTKHTLGTDRIAAISGALYLYPQQDVLVIDAGTAITFDLINKERKYLGGNISPGLAIRYKALNYYTSRLPLVQNEPAITLMGQSTIEAIRGGVQNGLIFEIEGYVERLIREYPQLIVLLTGGDDHFFENKLKKTIFVVSNLTFIGLNFILKNNAHIN